MNAIKANFKQSIDVIKRRAASFSEAVWDSKNVGDLVRSAQLLEPIIPIVNALLKDRKLKNPSAGLSGSQYFEPHPDDVNTIELFYDIKNILRNMDKAIQKLFSLVENGDLSNFGEVKPKFDNFRQLIADDAWTLYYISIGERPRHYVPPTTNSRRSLNSANIKGISNPFIDAAHRKGFRVKASQADEIATRLIDTGVDESWNLSGYYKQINDLAPLASQFNAWIETIPARPQVIAAQIELARDIYYRLSYLSTSGGKYSKIQNSHKNWFYTKYQYYKKLLELAEFIRDEIYGFK